MLLRFTEDVRAHLRPDITFGADIIAGFPTETEAHFRKTLLALSFWLQSHLATRLSIFSFAFRTHLLRACHKLMANEIKSPGRPAYEKQVGALQAKLHLTVHKLGNCMQVLDGTANTWGVRQQFAEVSIWYDAQTEGKIIETNINSTSATETQLRGTIAAWTLMLSRYYTPSGDARYAMRARLAIYSPQVVKVQLTWNRLWRDKVTRVFEIFITKGNRPSSRRP